MFNRTVQREGETVDDFVISLNTLGEFGELKDSLIRECIILGIRETGFKQRLLRDP